MRSLALVAALCGIALCLPLSAQPGRLSDPERPIPAQRHESPPAHRESAPLVLPSCPCDSGAVQVSLQQLRAELGKLRDDLTAVRGEVRESAKARPQAAAAQAPPQAPARTPYYGVDCTGTTCVRYSREALVDCLAKRNEFYGRKATAVAPVVQQAAYAVAAPTYTYAEPVGAYLPPDQRHFGLFGGGGGFSMPFLGGRFTGGGCAGGACR